jgi:parallel beta-helix repeat protein
MAVIRMNRKILILLGMLYIAFSTIFFGLTVYVERAMAQNTIYIRANGIVDPLAAPIVTFDNVTYSFTGNVNEPVVVERSNVIVDVAGFTIQGTGGATGVSLTGISNVTIKNANIRDFYYGIAFRAVSLSGVYDSNVTSNSYDGVYFSGSSGNTISRNNITANGNDGIKLLNVSNYNLISGNNIVANNDDGLQISDCVGNALVANFVLANNDIGLYFSNSLDSIIDGNIVWANRHGIELSSSPHNTLSGNDIISNGWSGIRLGSSDQNSIVENNVTNNYDGIYVYECSETSIYRNEITTNTEYGLWLDSSPGNTAIENNILNNSVGIYIYRISSANSIHENYIASNSVGISISGSSNNIISENTIVANQNGVTLVFGSSTNRFYHNNFVNNVQQVSSTSANSWDDGLEGNFWSDYAGADLNNDGIGEVQMVLATGNVDRFPLMGMFQSFATSFDAFVNVISNSTIDDFSFVKSPADISITMHVSNTTSAQTLGFCRVTIPHVLMTEPYDVTIDSAAPHYVNFSIYDNTTHRWIYFNYNHSTLEVKIQGTDITPPAVTVLLPENTTYSVSEVPLVFTINETTSWIGYSLDGQANTTVTGNTTLMGLSEGSHSIVMFANDTEGNMGVSSTVNFSVDTMSPNIAIISPQNLTYGSDSVMLTFTLDEPTSWMGYSFDGQANVTIIGNTTLSGLLDGAHSVLVYANDTVDNMASSVPVYFSVDTTPPDIPAVSQHPPEDNVLPENQVVVNATVTDDFSGVGVVVLNYTTNNGTWFSLEMAHLDGDIWSATIPALPYCTTVNYTITAEDTVGNSITTDELAFTLQYHVIPEFASPVALLLLMTAAFLVVSLGRHKRFRG